MSIFNLFTIFIVIVSILLVATILLQEPKERITPSGGGAASIQRIGINQKADFLEKTTWLLVSLLLLFTLLSSVFLKSAKKANLSPNLAKVQQEQLLNTPLAPSSTENETLPEKNDQTLSKSDENSSDD